MSLTTTYKKYLESAEWQTKRDLVLRRDRWACRRCQSQGRLEVHHLTYARVPNERMADMVTLCHACHKWIHKLGFDISVQDFDWLPKRKKPRPTRARRRWTKKMQKMYEIGAEESRELHIALGNELYL